MRNFKRVNVRCQRVLAFIKYYQEAHGGITPDVPTIGAEIGARLSLVRKTLDIMQSKGVLEITKRRPVYVYHLTVATKQAQPREHQLPLALEPEPAMPANDATFIQFISDHWAKHNRGPYNYEMKKFLGLESSGSLYRVLRQLEGEGLISNQRGLAGGWSVVDGGTKKSDAGCVLERLAKEQVEQMRNEIDNQQAEQSATPAYLMPRLGTLPAGAGQLRPRPPAIAGLDTLDLILELNARGYLIARK